VKLKNHFYGHQYRRIAPHESSSWSRRNSEERAETLLSKFDIYDQGKSKGLEKVSSA
jgi:hypothetical protein